MIKICKYCKNEFEGKNDLNGYCNNRCRSRDKFVTIDVLEKKINIWKKNYEKYPDFYLSIKSYKDRLKNKCFICGKEYFKFSMCCSSECSLEMKKISTLETTGSTHNLSNKSLSRKKMEESLMINFGINNVFQRDDVKDKLKNTWSLKYGYDNPSKVDFIKNKKRKTAENNGNIIPKYLCNEREIYEENVKSITWSQMKLYGRLKFGNDIWERIKDSRKLGQKEWLTVDHKFSKNHGFINKIPCYIIGHICNLSILSFIDNRKKWSNCSVTIEDLYKEIEIFENILKFNK